MDRNTNRTTGAPEQVDTDRPGFDRRSLFRIGGLTVAAAALISACQEEPQLGRVGDAPTTTALPTATVDDPTLLRTASSIEHSLSTLYGALLADASLLPAAAKDIITRYRADHDAAAKDFEAATTATGGEAWDCTNPRLDSTVITPAMTRITDGTPASREAPAIPPSDDPQRDTMNLAHGLETMIASMYQEYVERLSSGQLRELAARHSLDASRRSALLALTINTSRPGGYLGEAVIVEGSMPTETTVADSAAPATDAPATDAPVDDAPAATEIPAVSAIPARFGQVAGGFVILGAGDENGVRLRVTIDTPSLNTYVYEYMTPAC